MNSLGVVAMPTEYNDDLKPKLKVRFAMLDVRQQKIAEDLQESNQTISAWVNGHKTPPLKKAFRLAKLLDCRIEDLWEYIEDKDE
ncbi:helix-turn-helix domain-containing protein [Priestia flexa]|uniref:helix-turn-helix transcriptional regulator n=1 Tax=Priestia flexa TaxID=86664 RepID=UPI000C24543C|nr:helix-turn-helix domain-containing protein [Priestia flexa]MEC0667061.1 helix-turn-helix domain-containing protein [Priestia flexa]